MEYIEEAIRLIELNKISTTEVADVLGKTGVIEGVHPLNPSQFKVGRVKFVYAINNSNYELHKQLAESDDIENKILFIYNVNCDRSIIGDLVSKYILFYKRAKAIVINGKMRDAHTLLKEKYPIWLEDVSPIGCVNRINGPEIDDALYEELKDIYDGAIMVCDDSGVVLIPKNQINAQLIDKLNFIELQEDIWYYCVDTLKMSTFDTVCLKKYLERGILPDAMYTKLKEYQK